MSSAADGPSSPYISTANAWKIKNTPMLHMQTDTAAVLSIEVRWMTGPL